MAPCSSSGLTPAPCVTRPPATSISRAEPPGLMLKAIAESFTTTALDQGAASAAISLDAATNPDPADGLADLNADRPIGVGDNALELRGPDCSGIDIKAARALAECFDRRIDLKHGYSAEIDEPDTARAERRYLLLSNPAVHDAPVVEDPARTRRPSAQWNQGRNSSMISRARTRACAQGSVHPGSPLSAAGAMGPQSHGMRGLNPGISVPHSVVIFARQKPMPPKSERLREIYVEGQHR